MFLWSSGCPLSMKPCKDYSDGRRTLPWLLVLPAPASPRSQTLLLQEMPFLLHLAVSQDRQEYTNEEQALVGSQYFQKGCVKDEVKKKKKLASFSLSFPHTFSLRIEKYMFNHFSEIERLGLLKDSLWLINGGL